MPSENDTYWMKLALEEALLASDEGEVPVGAVLVVGGRIVARAHNTRESSHDPTGHAEIIALRAGASAIKNWRLSDATLYVTKEPCVMCAGAIVNSRLGRLVYGCGDEKGGAVKSLYAILNDKRLNHQVEVESGLLAAESIEMLQRFFRARRA